MKLWRGWLTAMVLYAPSFASLRALLAKDENLYRERDFLVGPISGKVSSSKALGSSYYIPGRMVTG